MKKLKLILSFMLAVLLMTNLIGCKSQNKGSVAETKQLKKIKLAMVSLTPAYSSLFLAVTNGFFKEEGLDVEIITQPGATNIVQNMIAGGIDIGLAGPEQAIYMCNEGKENPIILFANTSQKNNGIIISRHKEENFQIKDLKGKTIIGSRPGGAQENALEKVLKENSIDPKKDVKIITNIALDTVPGAFKGGTGDYAIVFEPACSQLEEDGVGKYVVSLGGLAGYELGTSFFATKSYIEKNPEIIQGVVNGIYRGQKWIAEHSANDIAKAISKNFPDIKINLLEKAIQRYKDIDIYAKTPVIKEDYYEVIIKGIKASDSNLLKKEIPFNKVVDNSFAKKSVENIK